MKTNRNLLDRAIAFVAPGRALGRQRARIAGDLLQRHYEAAAAGRRTQGWNRATGDANAMIGPALSAVRTAARDLVRNNPHAESALSTIVDQAVGWGIVAKPKPMNKPLLEAWNAWAETTACDADGREDFYGLQQLALRAVARDGEVLVRRRWRRLDDGLPLPLQLQILEADYLDTRKEAPSLLNGGRILQGVEYDALGRRAAYWLYRDHPGARLTMSAASTRVPASDVQHVFRGDRAGQVRAISWFAPVLLRFKDFDEFEDATLLKAKIAACLAVLTTDVDGSNPIIGGQVDKSGDVELDMLEPGTILNVPPGREVTVVQPPAAGDYAPYAESVLRAIATGIGVTYEDLTGDYTDLPFSAGRMSNAKQQRRVNTNRWRLMIPQFCDPTWAWAMQAARLVGLIGAGEAPRAQWTAPPPPFVDPEKEGRAATVLVRGGLQSWSETVRERGFDPDELLAELAAERKKLKAAGVVLDSDPSQTTMAGQLQATGAIGTAPVPPPAAAKKKKSKDDDAEDDAEAEAEGDDEGEEDDE